MKQIRFIVPCLILLIACLFVVSGEVLIADATSAPILTEQPCLSNGFAVLTDDAYDKTYDYFSTESINHLADTIVTNNEDFVSYKQGQYFDFVFDNSTKFFSASNTNIDNSTAMLRMVCSASKDSTNFALTYRLISEAGYDKLTVSFFKVSEMQGADVNATAFNTDIEPTQMFDLEASEVAKSEVISILEKGTYLVEVSYSKNAQKSVYQECAEIRFDETPNGVDVLSMTNSVVTGLAISNKDFDIATAETAYAGYTNYKHNETDNVFTSKSGTDKGLMSRLDIATTNSKTSAFAFNYSCSNEIIPSDAIAKVIVVSFKNTHDMASVTYEPNSPYQKEFALDLHAENRSFAYASSLFNNYLFSIIAYSKSDPTFSLVIDFDIEKKTPIELNSTCNHIDFDRTKSGASYVAKVNYTDEDKRQLNFETEPFSVPEFEIECRADDGDTHEVVRAMYGTKLSGQLPHFDVEGKDLVGYFVKDGSGGDWGEMIDNNQLVASDMTVYAKYCTKKYSITFDVDGVKTVQVVEHNNVPNYGQEPTKIGDHQFSFQFVGWQRDKGKIDTEPDVATCDTKYTAVFQRHLIGGVKTIKNSQNGTLNSVYASIKSDIGFNSTAIFQLQAVEDDNVDKQFDIYNGLKVAGRYNLSLTENGKSATVYDQATVTFEVPINFDKNSTYFVLIKENGTTKEKRVILSDDTLSFSTSEPNGTFLLVTRGDQPMDENLILAISLGAIFGVLLLTVVAMVLLKKRKIYFVVNEQTVLVQQLRLGQRIVIQDQLAKFKWSESRSCAVEFDQKRMPLQNIALFGVEKKIKTDAQAVVSQVDQD